MKRLLVSLTPIVALSSWACRGSDGQTQDPSSTLEASSGETETESQGDGPSPTSSDTSGGEPTDPLVGLVGPSLLNAAVGGTEGPVWVEALGGFLVSNIMQNQIYLVTLDGQHSSWLNPSQRSNGLALDRSNGDLILCELATRRLARKPFDEAASSEIASQYQGQPLNGPNDLAVHSSGQIYFTDPDYGLSPADQLLGHNSLYRVDGDQQVSLQWQGSGDDLPNGVVLSPDESRLYMANSNDDLLTIYRFDVGSDGALSQPEPFVQAPDGIDGMCVDVEGNLYSVSESGVDVYAPDGSVWGSIAMSGFAGVERLTNCAFGGPEGRDLLVTSTGGVFHVEMQLAGALPD